SVLSIEGVDLDRYAHDRGLSIAGLFRPDGTARIRLIRGGHLLERVVKTYSSHLELDQALYWIIAPLIFWMMGTVVIIFLRPRARASAWSCPATCPRSGPPPGDRSGRPTPATSSTP